MWRLKQLSLSIFLFNYLVSHDHTNPYPTTNNINQSNASTNFPLFFLKIFFIVSKSSLTLLTFINISICQELCSLIGIFSCTKWLGPSNSLSLSLSSSSIWGLFFVKYEISYNIKWFLFSYHSLKMGFYLFC